MKTYTEEQIMSLPELKDVRAFYRERAPYWDMFMERELINKVRNKEAERMLLSFRDLPQNSIYVDIGIGTAEHQRRIEKLLGNRLGKRYIGVDIADTMLQKALNKYPDDTMILANARSILPLRSALADGLIVQHVLSLIPDEVLQWSIIEMRRVMKKGGILSGCVYVPSDPFSKSDFPRNYPQYREKKLADSERSLNQDRSKLEYKTLFDKAGFGVEDMHHITWDAVQITAIAI
ncbi:class I SAM-dependent methyltransferase [Candidatus Gottesmanbacteria bacterium]|nr:class I SAM-dependent methyltransferase [Candidatus Gottesmanbacteria bacterium]